MHSSLFSTIWVMTAVFLSGAASLVYQVVWIRRIISITSSTATAQAIILAVFMAGLGLGAWLAGQFAVQIRRPLAKYAMVEFFALFFAVLAMPFISSSGHIRWYLATTGMTIVSGPWFQLLLIAIYLLIPTTLLGMSLPFVVEHIERYTASRQLIRRGIFLGLLYGFNTLGAAAGCLLAGYVAIEWIGLTRSVLFGGSLALLAAGIAFIIDRSLSQSHTNTIVETSITDDPPRTRVEVRFLIAAALGGGIGLSAEVVWTRMVALIVLNTVYAYTQVLAAVLIGIACGGYLASCIIAQARSSSTFKEQICKSIVYLAILTAVWVSLIPTMMFLFTEQPTYFVDFAKGNSLMALFVIFFMLVPPTSFIAAILPLLSITSRVSYGAQAFGTLYAANTIGAIIGSLFGGFVMLPYMGLAISVTTITITSIGIALLLVPRIINRRSAYNIIALATITCLLMHFFPDIPKALYETRLPHNMRILEFREGLTSDVMVTEDRNRERFLWINSAWVASTIGKHHLLGHLPALFVKNPKRGLGIALGTGQTFSAILEHGVKSVDCVEINAEVIALSRKWFSKANKSLFDNKKVHVYHNDGRAFMRSTDKMYDIIVLEPLQAWSAGTTNLYTKEFYEEAKRVLNPGGVVAQWIPFYGQDVEETKAMVRAGIEVFPQASFWLYKHEGILILHQGMFGIDVLQLQKRIKHRKLEDVLAHADLQQVTDLLSLFFLGPEGIKQWTAHTRLLVDDHPFLEFTAARRLGHNAFVPTFKSLYSNIEELETYANVDSEQALYHIMQAKKVRQQLVAAAFTDDQPFVVRAQVLEKGMRTIPCSLILRNLYRELIMAWMNAIEKNGNPSPKSVETIYLRAISNDPSFTEAAINLAIHYAKSGRIDDAIGIMEKMRTVKRYRHRTDSLLQLLYKEKAKTKMDE